MRSKTFEMNIKQQLHSSINGVFWNFRRLLRFRRQGYRETGAQDSELSADARVLDERYHFSETRRHLFPFNGARNLATLSYLEKMLDGIEWPPFLSVLEPGCQDFSRLPALRAYFNKVISDSANTQVFITGVELDPFPVLRDLHSRWDKAQYYIALADDGVKYQAEDFFKWRVHSDLIICFYPFVSVGPALAWGLPAEFASAQKWLESFERVLSPGGRVLVVHQGKWEEEDFDKTRAAMNSKLILEKREVLECSFFKTAHPACASLYKK